MLATPAAGALPIGGASRMPGESAAGNSTPPAVGISHEVLQVVLFRAGGGLFAVTAEHVEQAQRVQRVRQVTVDLANETGCGCSGNLVLTVQTPTGRVFLLIDDVLEVASLPLDQIFAMPRLVADRHRGGYVSGVALRNDELAVLLDADALVDVARDRGAAAETGAGAT